MKSEPGPPMTLGGATAAHVHLIVWCKACRYQAEPATASLRAAEGGTSADPAEMAQRYGPDTPIPDWRERLVCSRYGSRDTDMVVTGVAALRTY